MQVIGRNQLRAARILHRAVKDGALPPAKQFICSSCGTRAARDYDHRDYDKPLDVSPVCRSCNCKLGAGANRGELIDRHARKVKTARNSMDPNGHNGDDAYRFNFIDTVRK